MKLFVKRLLVFSIPIILLAVGLEVLLRRIPNDYSYKANYLEKRSVKLNTLILGNSHALMGLNPAYFSTPAFNAASVSQTLEFDCAIYRKYQSRLPGLKLLLVPVDYFTLFTNLHKEGETWRIKNYQLYYRLNVSSKITDNFEILSSTLPVNTLWLKSYYLHGISHRSCTDLGWWEYIENNKNLDASGPKAAERHRAKNDRYFRENIQHLKNLIELAGSHKVSVLLYTSPAYKTYTSKLDTRQLQKTINALLQIQKEHANTTYYNFLTDKTFAAGDFSDADHLNGIGARKFSIKMDSVIRTLKF